MLSVTAPAGFGAPELPDAGLQQTPAGPRDASGPASPFASMLATRLAGAQTPVKERDDDAATASADPAPESAAAELADHATMLGAALAALGASPAAGSGGTPSTSAATSANVRQVTRDVTTLAPALRDRLGRVVARMQDEFGYKVQIAEAGRTQARQDYLFAQGRTRSGPVVTWTRDSLHTRGRAVDVTVDGSYDDPTAFARLQQIAQAEGLQTLGMRDPGHLQLPHGVPGGGGAGAVTAPALDAIAADGGARVTVESIGTRVEPAQAAGVVATGPVAQSAVAPVAAVASVAQVAAVAQVAGVASVGTTGALPVTSDVGERAAEHDTRGARGQDGSRVAAARVWNAEHTSTAAPLPAATATSGDGTGAGAGRDAGGDAPGRDRGSRATHAPAPNTAVGAAPAPAWASPAAAPTTAATDTLQPPDSAQTGAPVLGAIAAERIARVLDAQQASAPRTVSHLTLRVERTEGGEDRIRLDLRGRAVDARIDVSDVGTADQLTARTPELRAALAQHGFTTDDVRVQSGADVALAAGARDPSRDQTSRDANGQSDRAPDDRASGRSARDGNPGDDTRGDRRASDERQNRRRPADAYLDASAPNAIRRPAS